MQLKSKRPIALILQKLIQSTDQALTAVRSEDLAGLLEQLDQRQRLIGQLAETGIEPDLFSAREMALRARLIECDNRLVQSAEGLLDSHKLSLLTARQEKKIQRYGQNPAQVAPVLDIRE